MTVRPEGNNRKISLNFLVFKTQPNADVLSIYDGTTTNAPLIGRFSGSELPNSITATNSEGALTFTFVSDAYVNFSGWVATLTCIGGESVDEDLTASTKVYPNPNNGSFNIEACGKNCYTIYNTLGQCLKTGSF